MDAETRKLFEELAKAKYKNKKTRLRNRLVEKHLDLARRIAGKEWQRIQQRWEGLNQNAMLNVEDLYAAGVEGLISAVERFDLSRGYQFGTFAGWRIRGAIVDELRKADHVSRAYRAKAKRGEHEAKGMASLDVTLYEGGHGVPIAFRDLLADYRDGALDERLAEADFWKAVCRGLSIKERLLLLLYYRERLSMKEIGRKHLGVSESRVSQLHKELLGRIARRDAT